MLYVVLVDGEDFGPGNKAECESCGEMVRHQVFIMPSRNGPCLCYGCAYDLCTELLEEVPPEPQPDTGGS